MEFLGSLGAAALLLNAFIIALIINTLTLQTTCGIIGIPPPPLPRGAGMVALAMFGHLVLAFQFAVFAVQLLRMMGKADSDGSLSAMLVVLGLVVLIIAPVWLYKVMLPATLGRAMMVYLMHMFVLVAASVPLLVFALAATADPPAHP